MTNENLLHIQHGFSEEEYLLYLSYMEYLNEFIARKEKGYLSKEEEDNFFNLSFKLIPIKDLKKSTLLSNALEDLNLEEFKIFLNSEFFYGSPDSETYQESAFDEYLYEMWDYEFMYRLVNIEAMDEDNIADLRSIVDEALKKLIGNPETPKLLHECYTWFVEQRKGKVQFEDSLTPSAFVYRTRLELIEREVKDEELGREMITLTDFDIPLDDDGDVIHQIATVTDLTGKVRKAKDFDILNEEFVLWLVYTVLEAKEEAIPF